MTLQTLNTTLIWPGVADGMVNAPGVNTDLTLDAAGEYWSYVFCARQDMVISHVGWRTGTVAGSPTADTRIETVDASTGVPTGTLWATNTNIVSGTLTSTTWTLHALTASASITKGQLFAVKVVYASGTSIIVQKADSPSNQWGLPYRVTNVSGSDVKARPLGWIVLALGSSSTTFYQLTGALPVTTGTNSQFNNTNSAARGMRFKVPFKCRVVGLRLFIGTDTGDFNGVIYDDAGAELSSSSTAMEGAVATGSAVHYYLDSPVILSPDTWYRAAVEPSSVTNTRQSFWTLPSADYQSGTPGGGNQHYTTRASGTWDDSGTDKISVMDIIIDQLDDGVATVAPQHGNMTGGMQ